MPTRKKAVSKLKRRKKTTAQVPSNLPQPAKGLPESFLPFEKPIIELEKKIQELKNMSTQDMDLNDEAKDLEKKLEQAKRDVFANLTAWQRVQVARHPRRPYTLDYVRYLASDFLEIHGDRLFSDDKAMVGGFATIDDQKWMVIGHQKGRGTHDNLYRSFGSAHPEGYRKAIRLMRMAERFKLPILTFIDTPGAYPGVGAEERGQALAIAYNLRDMAGVKTPIVAIVIGEGGSGGALGIGVADRLAILENAYYSVISPEGCAAILWKDNARAPEAAEALKLTAQHLLEFKIADDIIPEPLGGAHRDVERTAQNIKKQLNLYLAELQKIPLEKLIEKRYHKYRQIGVLTEV
jgi:acetyl-CoA carboxylase carboxyl transferase subunit alpha